MALDVNRLASRFKGVMLGVGAIDNSTTTAFSLGLAQAVVDELGHADVLPDGASTPMKVGSAFVTGSGRIA